MHTNRLFDEKSPYLLQHAHNPVDWYPWGDEAFSKARAEDKPIFLSVGYSTCHWCHVMERESFENEEIAAILNRDFISIKLDREERPDVDRVYMTFVQATTGSGGWPMSVWLTPELKPFYGGTYFPPDSRYGRPGFAHVLAQLAEAWRSQRDKVLDSSVAILSELESYTSVSAGNAPVDTASLDSCFYAFRRSYDSHYGGFGGAPKFPRPSVFNFLFRYFHRSGEEEARDMALHTLREMAAGGMCDQLGGGFHRYSVDERWFVPHFEKMLYDQAQLAVSFVEAFQISGDPLFARVARGIFDYVLRDMTHQDGGFYSAEDADSAIDAANPHEKSEGAFYIWSYDELVELLGVERAARFAESYGCLPGGNVDHDPHGEFTGKNILYQKRPVNPAGEELAACRRILLDARSRRPRPHLDDKILTSWNAMMISALARGAQVLGEPRYRDAAFRAFDFLMANLYDESAGIFKRRWRDGDAAIDAFLDDYAGVVLAALDLYEITFEPRHLDAAVATASRMVGLFEDSGHGAFFSAPESNSELVLRMKEDYDGAEPSGNSLAVSALLRVAARTGNEALGEKAQRALTAFSSRINQQPVTIPQMLCALMESLAPKSEIQLSGAAQPLLDEFRRHFRPFTTVSWQEHAGEPSATLCEDFVCKPPVNTVSGLRELLN